MKPKKPAKSRKNFCKLIYCCWFSYIFLTTIN
jgi:hypothetical protein